MKKVFPFVWVLLTLLFGSCGEDENTTQEEPAVPVTGISFSKSVVSVEIGKTRKLKATLTPTDASNRGVVWSSSNQDIVTISKGVVTGIKEGEAAISVKTVDGEKIATCIVKVASQLTSYAIGDLYPDNEHAVGVVFWLESATVMDSKGFEGKVMSFDESLKTWGRSGVAVNATNEEDGAVNMAIIRSLENWKSRYPAFKWCADKGEGWYLPASGELLSLYENKERVNAAIQRVANTTLVSNSYYWTSTEYDESPETLAGCLYFRDATIDDWASKSGQNWVRAVRAF